MEPMNLGTPSNSGPSSPTTPSGSPYLPSFLLGEPTTLLPGSTSPKVKRGSLNDSQSYMSPRYFVAQSPTPQNDQLLYGEKVSGPPIRGLFDTVTSPGTTGGPKKPNNTEVNAYVASVSRQFNEGRTPSVPLEAAESTWVTVFGYPPAAASFILSQLATCGQIVTRQVPASGNWMHVQFRSRLEARRALACNGKVFAGSVMVGVLPCRDQSIVEDKTYERPCETSPIQTMMSPQRSYQQDMCRSVDASVYESPYGSPRISQARPLAARHDAEVYGSGSTPQKSTGIVSKAMEYILGW